jgi:competence protein ComEA
LSRGVIAEEPQHRLQIVGGVPGPGTSGSDSAGQLVNINTASMDEMRQNLHISAITAQSIVNYRQQNGPFTSIDQLQLVVSKTIYDKIKGLITI